MRWRAAVMAFQHPHLVARGVVAEDVDGLRAELDALKAGLGANREAFRATILRTCDSAYDAAEAAAQTPPGSGWSDGKWWRGYEAACADIRQKLADSRLEAKAGLETALRLKGALEDAEAAP